MQTEDRVFRRRRFIRDKMLEYGFEDKEGFLVFETDFMNGDFHASVTVDKDGKAAGIVTDLMNDEEYAQLRNPNYTGAYVGSVREAYEQLLTDIAGSCCREVTFSSEQSNRVAGLIYERYGVSPDFPWDGEDADEYGVFRHRDTGKWFGLIMNIRREQLKGCKGTDPVDVINLKKDTSADETEKTAGDSTGEAAAAASGIYPAFHMNHKLWISVVLDDTLPDAAVMDLIGVSFRLTDKKPGKMDEDLVRRVLDIADSVPAGQVITYGQIAVKAGIPKNARLVGKIMSTADRYGDHPCHRVVGHDGRTVPGWKEQRTLLEAEGITFNIKGCVDMKQHNKE